MSVILIADDEADNRELLADILEESGFDTVSVGDGVAAVEMALRSPPDLILLDVNMPGLSGIEVCATLRNDKSLRWCPIVILTADDGVETRLRCKRAGCDEFLLKPFDQRELVEQVNKLLQVTRQRRSAEEQARRLLEERESLKDQLIRAERLATLGTLAAGVGHELKNVSVVLRSAVQEITEAGRAGRAIDPTLAEDLSVAFEHVHTHATNLLSLGRPGPDFVAPIDLRDIVQQAISLMRHCEKSKFISVCAEMPEHPVRVPVNRTRVEQVLFNLIGNAADALNDAQVKNPQIVIRVEDRGDGRIACSVTDNGPGIPSEILPRIFESYFTTKPAGRGTGLGLGVARQIVESYGGRLDVATSLGFGTTFAMDFPVAEAEAFATVGGA